MRYQRFSSDPPSTSITQSGLIILLILKTSLYSFINARLIKSCILWTQTITLTEGAVNNALQKTWDQTRENTPQRLLARYSLAEPSLAKPSLIQPTGYDWWD